MSRLEHESSQGTLTSYIVGFILSLELTMAAYLLVSRHLMTKYTLAAILTLAMVQLMVQLIFFLHLGRESKPRWNLTVLLFAALVLIILVFGSLWIMDNLNYHTMSPEQTDQSIIKDEGIKQ